MSLFPAYADSQVEKQQNENTSATASSLDWLKNASFKTENALAIQSRNQTQAGDPYHSDASNSEEADSIKVSRNSEQDNQEAILNSVDEREHKHHRKKKKKKHKKHKKHEEESYSTKEKRQHDHNKVISEEQKHQTESKTSIQHSDSELSVNSEAASGKVFIEEIHGLAASHAFRIDRKCDANNLVYGGLYKLHIANHKTIYRDCLGHLHNKVIMLDVSDKHKKHKRKRAADHRYFGKDNVSLIKTTSGKMGRSVQKDTMEVDDGVDTFIPVSMVDDDSADESRSEANPLGIYDEETERYIQGKTPTSSTSVFEQSNYETVDVNQPLKNELKIRITNLNQRLRENPNDIEKWIQLVKLQDEVVAAETWGHEKEKETRKRLQILICEKKQAILQKAIQSNPANLELKLLQLKLSQESGDYDSLLKEWKELIFVHANNIRIWKEYLQFLQSFSLSFSVSSVLKAYGKCLSTLNAIVCGTMKSHDAKPGTLESMLEIVYQLGHFLRQAGHMEKAVALYQALIEFNLFCLDVVKAASHKDKLEIFEAFWDSAVPRFGEPNSRGWDRWVADRMQSNGDSSTFLWSAEKDQDYEDVILNSDAHRPVKWLQLERQRCSRHWLPWRPDTAAGEREEDLEDPERMILVDDISSWLFTLTSESSRFQLITQCLELLNIGRHWETSSPQQNLCVQLALDGSCVSGVPIGSGSEGGLPVTCGSVQCDEDMLYRFVENVIQRVSPKFTTDYQTQLTLLFVHVQKQRLKTCGESDTKSQKQKLKELKKTLKSILKESENRNNLALWEEFCLLEWQSGHREEASRILVTTENMITPHVTSMTDRSQQASAIKLYRTHAELELGISGANTHLKSVNQSDEIQKKVLVILTNLSTDEKSDISSSLSTTKVLKARKNFQTYFSAFLKELEAELHAEKSSSGQCVVSKIRDCLLHWTVCHALFQYVTVGSQAASVIYKEAVSVLGDLEEKIHDKSHTDSIYSVCHYLQEVLLVAHVRFLQFQVSYQQRPLSDLRVNLQHALQRVPHSWDLLSMYVHLENQASIAGRLRRHFHHATVKSEQAAVWLFAVAAELHRWQKIKQVQRDDDHDAGHPDVGSFEETGITHRIRAWFERITSNSSTQHCVMMWRLYFRFEIELGHKERALAVFYTALQSVPHAKLLYLDVVEHLPDELQRVIDLMTEKEIRVHMPLEELDVFIS